MRTNIIEGFAPDGRAGFPNAADDGTRNPMDRPFDLDPANPEFGDGAMSSRTLPKILEQALSPGG